MPSFPPNPEIAAAGPARRVVIVLGMHRSGTSAVAGCLQRLGVDFGPRLMPPTPDNARGFYEHIDIVNLHDRLLLAAGSSWDETDPPAPDWLDGTRTARFREDLREILARDFAAAPLWGIKDPRLCRLLPWWQPLWPELASEPLFVIVLRDPREVAASLARRDGFSRGKAYLLWLEHILAAERETRTSQRVFLDFADFLTDWRAALEPVRATFGLSWPPASGDERFVDQALPRANQPPVSGEMPPWVDEVDVALRRERGAGPGMFAVLDRVAEQLAAAHALFGNARDRTDDSTRRLAASERQARWYEEEWQKARRRAERGRQEAEKRRSETQTLQNRILGLESVVSDMRIRGLSDVRERRGLLNRFFAWVRSFV